uniref:BTB domain-containing protein n=1 Tax=Zooxanthella nutricula TaxID=1333877 RepID=A0A7S2VM03_9DINO
MDPGLGTDMVFRFAGQDGASDGKSDEEFTFRGHSLIVRMVSPVFDAMLKAGMAEQQQMTVNIDAQVASKDEFQVFYNLLLPFSGSVKNAVTAANAESLFRISDFYQVKQLRAQCLRMLLMSPHTVGKLIFAHKTGLADLYATTLRGLGPVSTGDIELAKDVPQVLADVAKTLVEPAAKHRKLRDLRMRVNRLSAELDSAALPPSKKMATGVLAEVLEHL